MFSNSSGSQVTATVDETSLAKEATLEDVKTDLDSIDGKVSTEAKQDVGNSSLASIDTKLTSPLSVSGPLTDAQLRASPVPVSGTVTANAGTGPFPVSDNGGSLTVDGTVAISNFPATQPVSGTVAVSNFPATQPVSGTVTANLGTLNGASTAANQSTGNTSLSSLDTKTPSLGQAVMASSRPVVIASNQSAVPVSFQNSSIATYVASTGVVGQAATATDVFTISGSGTKTIKVLKVYLDTTQTLSGTNIWILMKRSTANTGGTSTSLNRVSLDSTNAVSTNTVLVYSVNPAALGTLVGNIAVTRVFSPPVGTFGDEYLWDFSDPNKQPIVLRGTGELLTLNFNGAATPVGTVINIRAIWTEE